MDALIYVDAIISECNAKGLCHLYILIESNVRSLALLVVNSDSNRALLTSVLISKTPQKLHLIYRFVMMIGIWRLCWLYWKRRSNPKRELQQLLLITSPMSKKRSRIYWCQQHSSLETKVRLLSVPTVKENTLPIPVQYTLKYHSSCLSATRWKVVNKPFDQLRSGSSTADNLSTDIQPGLQRVIKMHTGNHRSYATDCVARDLALQSEKQSFVDNDDIWNKHITPLSLQTCETEHCLEGWQPKTVHVVYCPHHLWAPFDSICHTHLITSWNLILLTSLMATLNWLTSWLGQTSTGS